MPGWRESTTHNSPNFHCGISPDSAPSSQLQSRLAEYCRMNRTKLVRRDNRLCPPKHTTSLSVLKMALLNARSITNTFILNDLFKSHNLDFLFLCNPGEVGAKNELTPVNCRRLKSPILSGRGGGTAAIFKRNFKCCMLPPATYQSFELQLIRIDINVPLLCAMIYGPPRSNSIHSKFF